MPAKPAASGSKAGEAKAHEAAGSEIRQVNGKAADVKKAATGPSKKPAEPSRQGSAVEKHHEKPQKAERIEKAEKIERPSKAEKPKKAEKPEKHPAEPAKADALGKRKPR